MEGKKVRGKSGHESELYKGEISVEDLTVMKLMEEIMEFDQEIKMKQRWINSRMKLLHQLLPKQKSQGMEQLVETFLQKIQPEYPNKISVEYLREGEKAIPMGMSDVYSQAI